VSPVKYELGFYIPEDAILHSHRRGKVKSYTAIMSLCTTDRSSVFREVRTSNQLYFGRDRAVRVFGYAPVSCAMARVSVGTSACSSRPRRGGCAPALLCSVHISAFTHHSSRVRPCSTNGRLYADFCTYYFPASPLKGGGILLNIILLPPRSVSGLS
jgi:hypothetical protein